MTVDAGPGHDEHRAASAHQDTVNEAVPVLWLCGPPGVGKTTIAWEIYAQLARIGTHVGYVDIDQLGMCFPEPATDPGRHRMQARNLDTVVTAFGHAGADCVIVSGVVHPTHGAFHELTPHAALTVCRLHADAAELARRVNERSGAPVTVSEAFAEAEALESNDIGDVRIDTSNRTVADVVSLVHERTNGWRAAERGWSRANDSSPSPTSVAGGQILWLCGVTGVGKSTVGFATYLKAVFCNRFPGAYLDLDQIGFLCPAPADDPGNHRVRARIVSAMWQTFRAAGAECLTMVGPAEDNATINVYAEAVPDSPVTVCRLHAERNELRRRVMTRGRGGSWAQPGDPLNGLSDAQLSDIADAAAQHADALDDAEVGDIRIVTDGHTVEETIDAILTRTGWPEAI